MDFTGVHHEVFLQFELDADAHPIPTDIWKRILRYPIDEENILDLWRGYCELNSNRSLPELNRIEGGLGGDNNKTDKQVRFDEYTDRKLPSAKNDTIKIIIRDSDDGLNRWSIEELADLVQAFVRTCNHIIEANSYVTGAIILRAASFRE
jgi:hypothetical protein